MKGEVLSLVEAAAFGAKAAGVEVVPSFPAPFSVGISKKLSSIHKFENIETDSNGSAISSALGASAAGKRVFIPASSPLATEAFAAPYMRLPFVVCNVSRSLHGIRQDNTAIMALRDSGYLMFFPENCQEVHDMAVQAYKVCEDPKVLLPGIVNIDGLPNFSEVMQPAKDLAGWLPKPRWANLKKPLHLDLYSDDIQTGKLQLSKSMENAPSVIAKASDQWKQKFRRHSGMVEKFMTEDAETIIVTMGYHSSTARAAVRKLRAEGRKVGLLRIRVFRPWPAVDEILAGAKKVLVFEQAVSIGIGGILSAHIKRSVSQLICLGKYPSEKDFMDAISRVEKSEKDLKMWL